MVSNRDTYLSTSYWTVPKLCGTASYVLNRSFKYFCRMYMKLCQVSLVEYLHMFCSNSPVILAQKMGQPLTNCNINNFNCFYRVQKNVLYNISKVSVSLMRGKCFLSPFKVIFSLKMGFSVLVHLLIIQTTQIWY